MKLLTIVSLLILSSPVFAKISVYSKESLVLKALQSEKLSSLKEAGQALYGRDLNLVTVDLIDNVNHIDKKGVSQDFYIHFDYSSYRREQDSCFVTFNFENRVKLVGPGLKVSELVLADTVIRGCEN